MFHLVFFSGECLQACAGGLDCLEGLVVFALQLLQRGSLLLQALLCLLQSLERREGCESMDRHFQIALTK